jgi:hypothetical protein
MKQTGASSRAPKDRLRLDMNLGTVWGLPSWSSAPRDRVQLISALRDLGVEGVQGDDLADFMAAGFIGCGLGRMLRPADADSIALEHKRRGYALTTLHVGSGLESDAEMDALAAAVLDASGRHGYPLLIETHRATMTQDIRRTVDLIERFPDLRFNGDFSHWYTGLEMTYGDFDAKLRFLAPLFSRVRYMHGRVGDPGAIQRSLIACQGEPFVEDFRRLWRCCFDAFLATASDGDVLPFAPELLPYSVKVGKEGTPTRLYYARLGPIGRGRMGEESDRWSDAKAMLTLARDEFDAAVRAHRARRHSRSSL